MKRAAFTTLTAFAVLLSTQLPGRAQDIPSEFLPHAKESDEGSITWLSSGAQVTTLTLNNGHSYFWSGKSPVEPINCLYVGERVDIRYVSASDGNRATSIRPQAGPDAALLEYVKRSNHWKRAEQKWEDHFQILERKELEHGIEAQLQLTLPPRKYTSYLVVLRQPDGHYTVTEKESRIVTDGLAVDNPKPAPASWVKQAALLFCLVAFSVLAAAPRSKNRRYFEFAFLFTILGLLAVMARWF